MNRGLCLVLIFGILMVFSLGFVSSISTDLKQGYNLGETAIVKISGSVLEPITAEQVEFKRANVRIPFDYDIKRLGDDYYLWFATAANMSSGNYTLYINGISSSTATGTKNIDFAQNFTISNVLEDYYVVPGLIISKENFTIDAFLNRDENLEISNGIVLKPGKNEINFGIKSFPNGGLNYAQVGKYSIPTYIENNKSTAQKKNNTLEISPFGITSLRLLSDNNIGYKFIIRNTGYNSIDNVYISYGDIFTVTPNSKTTLAPDQSVEYYIQLDRNSGKNVNETIYVKSDKNNISYSVPVSIVFVKNIGDVNPIGNISEEQLSGYSCLELLGEICSIDESCNGETLASSDGLCCKGSCSAITKKASSSWIGYVLAILVLALLVFIYFRYKKVKPDKTTLEKTLDKIEKDTVVRKMP